MNQGLSDLRLSGLTPQTPRQATVLVLGSMPGTISLKQQQYYAHPRNVFWPIMARMCGFSAELPYQDKVQRLMASGVSLWDVIGTCQRAGSLDSAIHDEQVNNFAGFFASQPQLAAIGFNGAKAWQSFKRHVVPLHIVPTDIKLITLPSTSPAHATLDFAEKLKQWQQLEPWLNSITN